MNKPDNARAIDDQLSMSDANEPPVLAAVGVDATGRKHVLGLREGGSENATVVTALLEGFLAGRRYRDAASGKSSSIHAGSQRAKDVSRKPVMG